MTSYPATIKAIQVTAHGGPEVLAMNEIPFPTPQPNEILFKVEWGGMNFIDTYIRSGLYPTPVPFPFTSGSEAAGVIVQLPTDPAVLNDPEYQARNYKIGDHVVVTTPASFQQYVARNWINVLPVPSTVSTRSAAAIALSGFTALTFITEAYAAKAGEWVLVHAAAGGLGTILCQLLSTRGVHVIGTTSTPQKAEIAKSHGAKAVVVTTQEDTVKRVLELTGGEGVHGIYDGIGKDTWEQNFEIIRRKGTIVSIGNASGAVPPFPPLKLGPKNLKFVRPVMGNYMVTPQEISFYNKGLWGEYSAGHIKEAVSKEYSFTAEGVAQAHIDLAGRKTTGKVVIKIAK